MDMSADSLTVLQALYELRGDDPDGVVERDQIRALAHQRLPRSGGTGGIQAPDVAFAPVDEQLRWLEQSGLIRMADVAGLAPAAGWPAPSMLDELYFSITEAGIAELAARASL